MVDVAWARELAWRLLAGRLPRRWSHVRAVGQKAESIAHLLGDDGDLLICAGWLHDVGYAPELVVTGFHPLDGARYLRDVFNADDRLCSLVAHHSCAIIEGRRRGLGDTQAAEFPVVGGLVADALTYCDMTTGPDGAPVEVEVRLGEVSARYGEGDPVSEAMREAMPQIRRSVMTVRSLLAAGHATS